MDPQVLKDMLESIDAVPIDDMDRRYGLLCDLMAYVKKEAMTSPVYASLRSNNILGKLMDSIDAIPESNTERRYFQMVSLMIFIKRRTLFNSTSSASSLNRAAG